MIIYIILKKVNFLPLWTKNRLVPMSSKCCKYVVYNIYYKCKGPKNGN